MKKCLNGLGQKIVFYGCTLYTIYDDNKKLYVDIIINHNQVSFNAVYTNGRQFIKNLYKHVFFVE